MILGKYLSDPAVAAGLGALGSRLMAAGAPSLDPGNWGKQMGLLGGDVLSAVMAVRDRADKRQIAERKYREGIDERLSYGAGLGLSGAEIDSGKPFSTSERMAYLAGTPNPKAAWEGFAAPIELSYEGQKARNPLEVAAMKKAASLEEAEREASGRQAVAAWINAGYLDKLSEPQLRSAAANLSSAEAQKAAGEVLDSAFRKDTTLDRIAQMRHGSNYYQLSQDKKADVIGYNKTLEEHVQAAAGTGLSAGERQELTKAYASALNSFYSSNKMLSLLNQGASTGLTAGIVSGVSEVVGGLKSAWKLLKGAEGEITASQSPSTYDYVFNKLRTPDGAQLTAEYKGLATQLAYQLAQLAEPGGKLSDADVARWVDALGANANDPAVVASNIVAAREQGLVRLKNHYIGQASTTLGFMPSYPTELVPYDPSSNLMINGERMDWAELEKVARENRMYPGDFLRNTYLPYKRKISNGELRIEF